jgi:hypothetical protein
MFRVEVDPRHATTPITPRLRRHPSTRTPLTATSRSGTQITRQSVARRISPDTTTITAGTPATVADTTSTPGMTRSSSGASSG